MDVEAALERIYQYVEEGEVDKAVMACLRIARHLNDHMSAALFLREMHGNKKDAMRALYDDVSHLKNEAQKYLWEKSGEDWLENRTLPFSMGEGENGEERNVLVIGIGVFDSELEQLERSIQDLVLPNTMGEFDSAAFTDRYNNNKSYIRLRIHGTQVIKERIRARCLDYAIRIEKQLVAQKKSRNFLESVQNEVNNFFKARSESVYKKLQNATQLIDTNNSEDLNNLLTQVRRTIKATADFLYPPNDEVVTCSDGKDRALGDDKYLNRLQEYLMQQVPKSSSRDVLLAEFEHFAVFARRLNDIASKGVHSDVSLSEAKQGLLGLYLFLYNLLHYVTERQPDEI